MSRWVRRVPFNNGAFCTFGLGILFDKLWAPVWLAFVLVAFLVCGFVSVCGPFASPPSGFRLVFEDWLIKLARGVYLGGAKETRNSICVGPLQNASKIRYSPEINTIFQVMTCTTKKHFQPERAKLKKPSFSKKHIHQRQGITVLGAREIPRLLPCRWWMCFLETLGFLSFARSGRKSGSLAAFFNDTLHLCDPKM